MERLARHRASQILLPLSSSQIVHAPSPGPFWRTDVGSHECTSVYWAVSPSPPLSFIWVNGLLMPNICNFFPKKFQFPRWISLLCLWLFNCSLLIFHPFGCIFLLYCFFSTLVLDWSYFIHLFISSLRPLIIFTWKFMKSLSYWFQGLWVGSVTKDLSVEGVSLSWFFTFLVCLSSDLHFCWFR